MKTAQEVKEIFLSYNGKLKKELNIYDLTIDEVEVYLYDEDMQTSQRIDNNIEKQPIMIYYSITNNKPYSLAVDFTNSKIEEEEQRERRLKKVNR